MRLNEYCDGVSRRDFVKVGVCAATGMTLADYFRMVEAGQVRESGAKSAIFIQLPGGPTHMDTFDLKPDAPAEYRGEFKPIKTNVAGVEISEHLPKLAKVADKFAILRGVSHTLAAHELGRSYMMTGNRPLPSIEFPGIGSVIAKEKTAAADIPPYVAVPNTSEVPGYLGIEYAAFATNATPKQGVPFNVRGVSLGNGLTVEKLNKRRDLLTDLDRTFASTKKNDLVSGLDKFSQRAHDIISSPRTRQAFDISKERGEIADMFGGDDFSQSCLLATRLVESGVRFVSVSTGGWDTHQDNFTKLKDSLLPKLDAGLAGLFAALAAKGMLDSTAVFVTGEFGRTPKINQRAGRDHWARAMFCLLAGGGIKGGQVIGASDDKGMGPASTAITPDQVVASYYHALGIDFHKEYHTNTGRPVMIVRDGSVVPGLFA